MEHAINTGVEKLKELKKVAESIPFEERPAMVQAILDKTEQAYIEAGGTYESFRKEALLLNMAFEFINKGYSRHLKQLAKAGDEGRRMPS